MKPHPEWSLVTEPSMHSMRSCGLLCSLMRSLLAILATVFPSFLTGVSHRGAGIGLGTFPFSLVCLSSVSWHTCSTESSVCVLLCLSVSEFLCLSVSTYCAVCLRLCIALSLSVQCSGVIESASVQTTTSRGRRIAICFSRQSSIKLKKLDVFRATIPRRFHL